MLVRLTGENWANLVFVSGEACSALWAVFWNVCCQWQLDDPFRSQEPAYMELFLLFC